MTKRLTHYHPCLISVGDEVWMTMDQVAGFREPVKATVTALEPLQEAGMVINPWGVVIKFRAQSPSVTLDLTYTWLLGGNPPNDMRWWRTCDSCRRFDGIHPGWHYVDEQTPRREQVLCNGCASIWLHHNMRVTPALLARCPESACRLLVHGVMVPHDMRE